MRAARRISRAHASARRPPGTTPFEPRGQCIRARTLVSQVNAKVAKGAFVLKQYTGVQLAPHSRCLPHTNRLTFPAQTLHLA